MKKSANQESPQKLKFPSKEEAKWGSVNFRTALWTYFFDINNGKALTESNIRHVTETFKTIQAANEILFGDVSVEEIAPERQKKLNLLEAVAPMVNKIINAKSLSELKRIWVQILDGDYNKLKRDQKAYLDDIKNKRKVQLLEAN